MFRAGRTMRDLIPRLPGGVLRPLNVFCIQSEIDVSPVYIRSEHNIVADGLTRWSHAELEDWVSQEGMAQIDGDIRLWAGMGLSYNPDTNSEPPPKTFALLGHILDFSRPYNYRVCEWRPSHYAVANVMGGWGIPVSPDQILGIATHDLLVRRASHPLSVIGDKDIFMLIGYCSSWA